MVSDGSEAIRLAERFLECVADVPHDGEICDATRQLLADPEAVEVATRALLRGYELPADAISDVRFRPTRHDEGFTVDTNIDFARVNKGAKRGLHALDEARLIGAFASARSKLNLAARSNADLETSRGDAALVAASLAAVVQGRAMTCENVELFQRMAFANGHAIADAVNRGDRSFSDVIALLQKAEEFRKWLAERPPTVELINAYYRDATKDWWVSTLPAKILRWVVTTAGGAMVAGPVGGVVGAALGAADTFVVDRLLGGWRPNQFVDGPLKAFVDDE